MERLSFRRGDRLVGRLTQALGELGDGRVQIDFTHRHGRHARTLPDAGAEARHQQGVRARGRRRNGHSVETWSTFSTSARARERKCSLVRLGGDQLGAGRDARPLRLRQLPVIGLVADRHRDERQFLEICRNHVGRQPASQRVRDLAARQDRCVLLQRVVGHELDPFPARARRWSPPPARSPANPAARISISMSSIR